LNQLDARERRYGYYDYYGYGYAPKPADKEPAGAS